jgi:hypothetical protein
MSIKVCGTDVIDNSRNVVNAGTGCFSGTVTANAFSGDGSCLTNVGGFAQDADANLFAGNNAGGPYNPAACSACFNTFLGCNAGCCITAGDYNIFLGKDAGFRNTTGCNNTFFGRYAGQCNAIGDDNIAIGQEAGFCNNNDYNIYIGYKAGRNANNTCVNNCWNTTIGFCAAHDGCGRGTINIGYTSGRYSCGQSSIHIGGSAGRACVTGSGGDYNTFIGNASAAGCCLTSGHHNNFLGDFTGYRTTTGSYNVFIGSNAGCCNSVGSNNIAIGCFSGAPNGGLCTLSGGCNVIVMGNSSHSCAKIMIGWTTASDIRDKCVYGDVPYGKAFLQGVNPIKYGFKDRETGELKDDKKRYGFSAQEIASLEDEPIIVDNPDGEKLGVTHDYLLPILVNAIKELDAENKELKERLLALEERVNNLS